MSRSLLYQAGVALVAAGGVVACGGSFRHVAAPAPEPAAQGTSTVDRMTVRTGEQELQVDSPVVIARQVEHHSP